MKRKSQRLVFVVLGVVILGVASGLALYAMRDSLQFFYSPSDLLALDRSPAGVVRLGGLVEDGSLSARDGLTVRFRVRDGKQSLLVRYDQQAHGLLPDLFREGQGVIVEGTLGADGGFDARSVLAKHDENYMPPEVADALKRSGEWRGDRQ